MLLTCNAISGMCWGWLHYLFVKFVAKENTKQRSWFREVSSTSSKNENRFCLCSSMGTKNSGTGTSPLDSQWSLSGGTCAQTQQSKSGNRVLLGHKKFYTRKWAKKPKKQRKMPPQWAQRPHRFNSFPDWSVGAGDMYHDIRTYGKHNGTISLNWIELVHGVHLVEIFWIPSICKIPPKITSWVLIGML